MSRTVVLIVGGICWAGVAIVAVLHLMMGDLLVPFGMAAAFLVWAAIFAHHYDEAPAEVPAND
jgi:hypothetical protein